MENGNSSKFYFKAEDLKALLDSGASHIVVNTETGYDNITTISIEGYSATAASTGSSKGCPWPCGGTFGSAISTESLEAAKGSY